MRFTEVESIDKYYSPENYEILLSLYLKDPEMETLIKNSKQEDKKLYKRRLKSDLKKMILDEDIKKPRYVKFTKWIEREKRSSYDALSNRIQLEKLIEKEKYLQKKENDLNELERRFKRKEKEINALVIEKDKQIKNLEIDNDRLRESLSFQSQSLPSIYN
jgi:hypothetical protein